MKRRWVWLGAAAAVAAAWFGGPPLLRKAEFFRVRRVEFVGLRYQAADSALKALKLPRRLSVFDDLDAIRARARRIPGIRSAEVGRRLPGTLVVRVEERAPVALVTTRQGLRLMDASGALLPFDPVRSAPDLPVADTATAAIGQLLSAIRRVQPGLFRRIAVAGMAGRGVAVTADGHRYLFRRDASNQEMRAVMLVAADLTRKGRTFGELDGRFTGYVVVRGAGA